MFNIINILDDDSSNPLKDFEKGYLSFMNNLNSIKTFKSFNKVLFFKNG